jgi:Tfp pilus assembly protein PilF
VSVLKRSINIGLGFLLVLLLLSGASASASPIKSLAFFPVPGENSGGARVTIELLDETGQAIGTMAIVHLRHHRKEDVASSSTGDGLAVFQFVAAGNYLLVVEAQGFQTTSQEVQVELGSAEMHISLTVRHEATGGSSSKPGGAVLSPKLQRELSKTLKAMQSGNLDEAQKHADAAYTLAPANPDVNYMRGLVAQNRGDLAGAQASWEKTVSLDPSYIRALLAIGKLKIEKDDYAGARGYLEQALQTDANSWRVHELLAEVSLKQGAYPDAITRAERSLELGKNLANSARLPLAQALIAENDRDRSAEILHAFLQGNPSREQAALAHQLLDGLQGPQTAAGSSSESGAAPQAFHFTELPPLPVALPSWIPSGVDDFMPAVQPGVACPLQEVLDGAAKNVRDFTKAVDRFTATETLDHQLVNEWGFPIRHEKRQFNYVVEISELREGFLDVEEYRDGTQDLSRFPDDIATLGLPAAVLLFHPYYRDDFEVTCEGLGRWKDSLAWQVHFSQRPGKPIRLRGYRIGARGSTVGIALKGRAWIQKDNLQVVRMETDLVAPLPEIKLAAEHQDIEFGPVKFRKEKEALWLPASADIYFDLHGHKFRRRNSFNDYLLFAVDDKQKITVPKVPKETSASDEAPQTAGDTAKP